MAQFTSSAPVDTPNRFYKFFTDNSGETNFDGDYSTSAKTITIKPETNETWYISSLTIKMIPNYTRGTLFANGYGGGKTPLKNGITIDLYESDVLIDTFLEDYVVNTNIDWLSLTTIYSVQEETALQNHILAKWDSWQQSGLYLQLDDVDRLEITLNDDFTDLLSTHQFIVQGTLSRIVDGVVFDGTNDYLHKDDVFDGSVSDGDQMTLSVWFLVDNVSNNMRIFQWNQGTEFCNVKMTNAGAINIFLEDSGNTLRVDGTTAGGYDDGGWHHLLISIDKTDEPNSYIYIDDLDVTPTWDTFLAGGTFAWSTHVFHGIGATGSGGSKFVGEMAQFWWDNTYIDLGAEANRRLFITADCEPVDLGNDGSTPTGSSPIVYINGDASTWNSGENDGTGGTFVVEGSVNNSPNEPVMC